jgi:hypothetical protein
MDIHLFGPARTPNEMVTMRCDLEFASALLAAVPDGGDPPSHSATCVLLVNVMCFDLGKKVTRKTVCHKGQVLEGWTSTR